MSNWWKRFFGLEDDDIGESHFPTNERMREDGRRKGPGRFEDPSRQIDVKVFHQYPDQGKPNQRTSQTQTPLYPRSERIKDSRDGHETRPKRNDWEESPAYIRRALREDLTPPFEKKESRQAGGARNQEEKKTPPVRRARFSPTSVASPVYGYRERPIPPSEKIPVMDQRLLSNGRESIQGTPIERLKFDGPSPERSRRQFEEAKQPVQQRGAWKPVLTDTLSRYDKIKATITGESRQASSVGHNAPIHKQNETVQTNRVLQTNEVRNDRSFHRNEEKNASPFQTDETQTAGNLYEEEERLQPIKYDEPVKMMDEDKTVMTIDQAEMTVDLVKLNDNQTDLTVDQVMMNDHQTDMTVDQVMMIDNQTDMTVDQVMMNDHQTDMTVDQVMMIDNQTDMTVDQVMMNDDQTDLTVDLVKMNDNQTDLTVDQVKMNDNQTDMIVDLVKMNDNQTDMTVDQVMMIDNQTDMTVDQVMMIDNQTDMTVDQVMMIDNQTDMTVDQVMMNDDQTGATVGQVKMNEDQADIAVDLLKMNADKLDMNERVNLKAPEVTHLVSMNQSPSSVETGSTVARPERTSLRETPRKSAIPYNVMMTRSDRLSMRRHERSPEKVSESPTERVPEKPIETPPERRLSLGLLKSAPAPVSEDDLDWIEQKKAELSESLDNFNVKADVLSHVQGPTVTRFEIRLHPGVKVNKVIGLTEDLKLTLSAKQIRIAPVPGKNTVGIEIPNQTRKPVFLKSLLQSTAYQEASSPLTAVLGQDITGQQVVTDLAKMPHGLIAGATGSGKSVCIHSLILSLIYKASPDELRLILIDPKVVELATYREMPHLAAPVITQPREAALALKWAVNEMERRYQLFADTGVRDLSRYNDLIQDGKVQRQKIPYIVIIIDELADLMMTSPQDVEAAICRIAQKARAAGIHMLLATQRPSVDVITGLIKSNIPTRIAFGVSSQADSRTILDMSGAERLLGQGDMLFSENGSRSLRRLQGTFVTDEEIERITDRFHHLEGPEYLFDVSDLQEKQAWDEEEDELFEEAGYFVIEQGQASVSSLQRRFRIGYNRAARLVDQLEAAQIITEANGSKPRQVLVDRGTFEQAFANGEKTQI